MRKSFILLHISVLLAGLTGIFGKLIHLNEVLITFYRLLFSGIIMILLDLFVLKSKTKYAFPELLRLGSVGFLMGLHWIFFYGSIKYSNISVGVVCFCLTGFFTAILGPIINRKKTSIWEIALSFLTLFGIGLIFSFDTSYRLGILLGVISSLFAALFTLFNEKLTRTYKAQDLIKIEMIGGTIGIGLLLPLILKFYPTDYLLPSASDFLCLLILAGLCTILLYILVNIALKKISAFTVNLSFNLEPIYSIIIAIVFFNEYKELNASFFIGLAIIIGSLILQMLRVIRQSK